MKTLILSLLRAGDILMQQDLFDALKKQNPEREIHLVINDEIKWISSAIKVDKIHFFPRVVLQRLMGEAEHHILRAHIELQKFIETLPTCDEAYNFTHTRLSAFLMEEIKSPVKKGLVSDGVRFTGLNNVWIKLFNERFSMSVDFDFHYTEILAAAFDIPLTPTPNVGGGSIRRVFMQAFTSDEKKNWNTINFRQLLDQFYKIAPNLQFKILASEKEKLKLERYFQDEEICTWNMEKLSSELNTEDLVISGDTAVAHLASRRGSRVIELALGSSDPWRTGPFGDGHIILQSTVGCYPCPHSKPCRQNSHLCGESISPFFIIEVVTALIQNKEIPASTENTKVFKTHIDKHTGWWLEMIGEGKGGYQVMNKILWQFANRPEYSFGKSIAMFFLRKSLPDLEKTQAELKENLFSLQAEFEILIQKLGNGEITITDVQKSRRHMASMKASDDIQEWLWGFQDLAQAPFATPLHFLSTYQDKLEQLKTVYYHRQKLIETLATGGTYESGTGKTSRDSFAET